VHFLKRAQDFVPVLKTSPHLEAALRTYEQMANSLVSFIDDPGLPDAGAPGYRARLTESLTAVRDMHQNAAQHLNNVASLL
jgi:hypothetical protein